MKWATGEGYKAFAEAQVRFRQAAALRTSEGIAVLSKLRREYFRAVDRAYTTYTEKAIVSDQNMSVYVMCVCIYMRERERGIHTCVHACMHTYVYIYIHTYTHTQTLHLSHCICRALGVV